MTRARRESIIKRQTAQASERGGKAMDVRVGDVLELKKDHPCGSREWLVLRVGMDFRLRCRGCGHELMLPRSTVEKNIKKIRRTEEPEA